MFNFSKCIDLLFRRVSPDDILEGFFNIQKVPLSESIDRQTFTGLSMSQLTRQFTGDEIAVLLEALEDTGLKSKDDPDGKKKSIFYLLLNFAQETLTEKDGEPLCRYEHLLRWNELSRKLGEDIFTTALLAYKDYRALNERYYFSWPPIISTDNIRLKNLLAKGVAENHFHLKGSAPHFSLSWVSVMNRFKDRGPTFKKIEKQTRLEPEIISRFTYKTSNLYTLVKKAAYIRAFLFERFNGCRRKNSLLDDEWLGLLKPDRKGEFNIYTLRVQHEVELLKYEFGKTFDNAVPDYAIPKNLASVNYNGNTLLYGERYFLYSMFKEIIASHQNKKGPSKYRELFYAYLVIKERLRQEFIQVNERIGFRNFQKYQDRKELLIPEDSIYEKALYYMSVKTSMKNQEIKSFETRITPTSTKEKLARNIKKIDDYLRIKVFEKAGYDSLDAYLETKCKDEKDNQDIQDIQFYTLHFIKFAAPSYREERDEVLCAQPRDYHTRQRIKEQAFAIMGLRKSMSPTASRIRGIDAASSEIGCRPEVFAQAFRFLKKQSLGGRYDLYKGDMGTKIEKLGATYHVGEDFLDIADGLRAIDEAVKFLSLTQGDRLGHALALGIDVFDYYELKQQRVILPRQDLLDNIVWLLSRIAKYAMGDFSQLEYYLERQYNRLFSEIYINHKYEKCDRYPHSLYYEAWRLRGDNPMLYCTEMAGKNRHAVTFWQRCAKNNKYPKDSNIRENDDVIKLYRHYHFNPAVKKKGMEMEEFRVEESYIRALQVIQKELQKEIRDKGIGIETNPSSNYLIGCFRDLCKHPIISFYNLGLTADPERINDCPQLFVSINTDDQGVFNTYLEKEYALMALALDTEEDQEGNKIYNSAMIYDWLDRIRQMGLEQSFK